MSARERRRDDERIAHVDAMIKALAMHAEELHRLASIVREDGHRGIAETRRTIANAHGRTRVAPPLAADRKH
jgi:hypothetical protein